MIVKTRKLIGWVLVTLGIVLMMAGTTVELVACVNDIVHHLQPIRHLKIDILVYFSWVVCIAPLTLGALLID